MEFDRISAAPVGEHVRQERVRTRDGVHLATDVYLPDGGDGARDDTPGDTILIRLPYDKNGDYTFVPLIAEYFLAHDYRVVAQDVRGKFRSEGEAQLFVNEVSDGEDTLDWITRQAWSNGRVAMWGDSYYGFTQWAAAASGHPALKAIAPRVTGTALGEPIHRVPGERLRGVEQAITHLYPLTHFFGNDTFFWEPDWSKRDFAAQAEALQRAVGSRSNAYDQWVPHPVTLSRFPNGSPFAGRPVPALHTIGWWDNCAPLSWADVAEIGHRPGWDALHYLRIESIDHESYQLIEQPGDRAERTEDQIRAILPRTLDPAIAFFEVFVRSNGSARDIPRVAWNLAGTDEMRTADVWPPTGTARVTRFAEADGTLGPDRPAAETPVTWTHDPDNLVPSSAPDAFSYLLTLPDEAPLGKRDDVLAFTGAAQTADVVLAGPVTAHVRARSTGPVMDCFVRLLDVAPDGTAIRIARGQRQLREAERALAFDIDLGQVGYLLRAGHRLAIHIAGSDYPEFLPQPGTGGDPWTCGTDLVPNEHTIVLGGSDACAVTIPLLEGTLA